jgi:hypothetical protein
MSSNVVMFGWNRPLPGREAIGSQHFQEFVEYLSVQQRNGAIESFDTVLLEPHGGTLNGFFLLRGPLAKLQELTSSADWVRHQVRAALHLDGSTVMRGVTGAGVQERMQVWMELIPKS